MKLTTTTEYVDALNMEVDKLRRQLKDNGIKPIASPPYSHLTEKSLHEWENEGGTLNEPAD